MISALCFLNSIAFSFHFVLSTPYLPSYSLESKRFGLMKCRVSQVLYPFRLKIYQPTQTWNDCIAFAHPNLPAPSH